MVHPARWGAAAIALIAMLGPASAQQSQLSDPSQQQRHDQSIQSEPGKAGKEEPSARVPAPSSTDAFVNGVLAVPGAPQDTQTVPAKFSQRNDALDQYPTMAHPLPLSDADKRRIADSVAKAKAPVAPMTAEPAEVLPQTIETFELPREVTENIPITRNLRYIRTADKVLLVGPSNMIVVEAIPFS